MSAIQPERFQLTRRTLPNGNVEEVVFYENPQTPAQHVCHDLAESLKDHFGEPILDYAYFEEDKSTGWMKIEVRFRP